MGQFVEIIFSIKKLKIFFFGNLFLIYYLSFFIIEFIIYLFY